MNQMSPATDLHQGAQNPSPAWALFVPTWPRQMPGSPVPSPVFLTPPSTHMTGFLPFRYAGTVPDRMFTSSRSTWQCKQIRCKLEFIYAQWVMRAMCQNCVHWLINLYGIRWNHFLNTAESLGCTVCYFVSNWKPLLFPNKVVHGNHPLHPTHNKTITKVSAGGHSLLQTGCLSLISCFLTYF